MKVSQLVPVEHICIGWPTGRIPESKDKWELIYHALQFLFEKAGLPQEMCKTAEHLVCDREKIMTTGIGHGIAIPHATIDDLEKPLGACIILSEGIDFEAIDHEAVQIIMLALIPSNDYKKHIHTLSSIVELTSLLDIKEKLLQAKTPEDVWIIISHLED